MVAPQFSPSLTAPNVPQDTSHGNWYNVPAGQALDGYTTNLVDPSSIAYKLTICDGISASIIITCVALRLASRRFIVKSVGSDDYLMLVALVLWLATLSMFQYSISCGMGKHLWDVRMTEYSPAFLQAWTIAAVFYSATMMFIKLSILFLYRRVFAIEEFMFRWWIVVAFTVGYSIAGICCSIFACTPIVSAWDLWVHSNYCINTAAFYIANGVFNCVSDLLILALPLPTIWGLSLARRQKIHLCMMFGVGTIPCVVSIIRLKSIIVFMNHGNTDVTYDMVAVNIWSQVECTVAFIGACTPALRPFLIWLFGSFFREQSSTSDHSKPSYTKQTPLRKLKSRASRDLFTLELGLSGKNRTLVSANTKKPEWDCESARHIVSEACEDPAVRERDSEDHAGGIVVHTTYGVRNGTPSPRLCL